MTNRLRSRRRLPGPKLPSHSVYEALAVDSRAGLSHASGLLAHNEGSRPDCLETLFRENLRLACIGVILSWDRAEILRHLENSVRGGLELLACDVPYRPTTTVHVDVTIVDDVVAHSDVRRVRLPEERAISSILYGDILSCAIAFGTAEQALAAASYPSKRHRTPGLIAPEALYTMLDAEKAYVKGDRAAAHALARDAMRDERLRVRGAPTLALLEEDWPAFESALTVLLRSYSRERTGGDPRAVMSLLGMALCRWAMSAGYVAEEGAHLPLSFLPEYPAA